MEIEHCALHLHRGCPHRAADVFWVGEDVEELLQLAAAQLRPPEVQKLEQSRALHHIQQEMPRPLTKPSCPGGPVAYD